MTVHVGPYEFDQVSYDSDGDVLYLRRGERRATAETFSTPEGHAVRMDNSGQVMASQSSTRNGWSSATAKSQSPCQTRSRRTPTISQPHLPPPELTVRPRDHQMQKRTSASYALSYICAHLPAGTTRPETIGWSPGKPNVPDNEIAVFTPPGSPSTLVIKAVQLPNGSTALRADAQVVWITPRPAL
jgi:hypothetical protein